MTMFKKACITFSTLLPLYCLCNVDPISDRAFSCPPYSYVDCLYFTNQTAHDQEETKNIQTYSAQNSTAYRYAHFYAHDITGMNHLTKRIDSRLTQAYAQHVAQYHRHVVCQTSYLPPDFKDTFEQRETSEKICATFFKKHYSKKAYAQAFDQKMITLFGPSYCVQAAACYQRAEMRRWSQYRYDGYREFIRTLPMYEDYMLEIAQQYTNDPTFAHKLRNTEHQACSTIISEAKRIIKKRTQEAETKKRQSLEKYNRHRQEIAHDIFMEQAPYIDQCVPAWKENNPKRAQAYYKVFEENGQSRLEYHELSVQAESSLRNYGLHPENYTSLDGNALQHEMLDEIIDGVKIIATIQNPFPDKSFDSMMHATTFKVFDGARRVNEMGDCFGASQLIDLAATLVDYSAAAVEGLAEGVIEGVHDGIVGTYHMLRHPLKTVVSLGKVALCIAKMAHDYIPLQQPLWLCTTEQERADYWRRHARIIQNWADVDKNVETWWRETPTREKIRTMTKGLSSAATNAVVGHQCMQLAGQVCKLATVETVALFRKAEQVEAVTAGTPGDIPKIMFNSMNGAELIAEAPANMLINKAGVSARLMEYTREFGLSTEQVSKALVILEEEGGCIERFHEVIEKFDGIKGVKNNIETVLHAGDRSNVRGAFFELESGLKLKKCR